MGDFIVIIPTCIKCTQNKLTGLSTPSTVFPSPSSIHPVYKECLVDFTMLSLCVSSILQSPSHLSIISFPPFPSIVLHSQCHIHEPLFLLSSSTFRSRFYKCVRTCKIWLLGLVLSHSI
jgi:hypothetical protein